VPVGHMCGHDMHVTWLSGATMLLAQARAEWRGTLMAVFQPAEETAEGAQAMIDDGLFDRFPKPAVVLGQHVMVGPAGTMAGRTGAITSAADSLQIRLFGRGAHGSMPQASVDPVVMAAGSALPLRHCPSVSHFQHPRPPIRSLFALLAMRLSSHRRSQVHAADAHAAEGVATLVDEYVAGFDAFGRVRPP
jgi:metal-dependent amidase/aminoacylase/carboxypeptidase family protein